MKGKEMLSRRLSLPNSFYIENWHILVVYGFSPARNMMVLIVLIQVVKTLVHVLMPGILSNGA